MVEVIYRIEGAAPRARYILHHVLRRMLGWEAAEAVDLESFRSSSLPRVQYGGEEIPGAINVRPAAILSGDADAPIPRIEVPREDHGILALVFFLLSRMEERNGMARDVHGRPRTSALWVSRHGSLHEPVVDKWVLHLADDWKRNVAGLPPVRRRYVQIATLDVDNGFMFLGRPLWRTMGSVARDLLRGELSKVRDRVQVLSSLRGDPYDVYEDFRTMTQGNATRSIVNFLVAPRGRYDHAVGTGDGEMARRMREVAGWAEVGLHPGYDTPEHPDQIAGQREALEAVIGGPVAVSRQHFLRMRWPSTMRHLSNAGFQEEHSMGLADDIGFRTGTCTPFPFYDLQKEEETPLMIHPFAVMDSAMAYAQGKTPGEAITTMRSVVDLVKAVQGTFIGVWHERFISDYGREKGWRRVVEDIIAYARP